MPNCLNCQEELDGNFCQNCGQKANTEPITMKKLLQDLPQVLFNWERGILYNIKSMFSKPGFHINEYLSGKRVRYYPPIQYALLVSAVLILMMKNLKFFHSGSGGPRFEGSDVEEYYSWGYKAGRFVANHADWFWPTYILFFSLATYLIMRNSKKNFAEHLYANAFIVGHISFLSILLFPISSYFVLFLNPLAYLFAMIFMASVFKTDDVPWAAMFGLAFLANLLALFMFLFTAAGIGFIFY